MMEPGYSSFHYTHAKQDLDSMRSLSKSELEAAIEDARQLKAEATCEFTRILLTNEEATLRAESEQRERSSELIETPYSRTAESGNRMVQIAKYAWDQSDKFVSIYADFPGIGAFPAASVVSTFEDTGFAVTVETPDNTQHMLAIPNLCWHITTDKCKVVIKAERFVVKLKKAEVKKEWEQLDDVERKKKEDRQQRMDNGDLKGASTDKLLKDMYDNADDEGKRGLREAMASGEEKRRKDSKK